MMISGNEKKPQTAEERVETGEPYRIVIDRAFAARESNSRLARDFFEKTTEEMQAQATLNRCVARDFADRTRQQYETFEKLAEGFTALHEKFPDSPPDTPSR